MNPHGQNAQIESHDLREHGVWECSLVEMIASWGSMHKNTLHKHEGELELCYLSLGRRIYVDTKRTCVMHGGNVWCNLPNMLHSSMGRPSGSAKFYCIDVLPPRRGKCWCGLDYPTAKEAWKVLQTLDPATQPLASACLQPGYDRLFALLDGGERPNRDLAIRMAFNALISNYVESVILPPKPVEGTEKVRLLIERINASDPSRALAVQDLVKEVGVSSSYFVNAFQKVVGQTPGQYIMARRLESASRRLATGMSIKDVAIAYDFDSTQHFTRAFHKYFLETPRKYYLRVKAERESGAADAALR